MSRRGRAEPSSNVHAVRSQARSLQDRAYLLIKAEIVHNEIADLSGKTTILFVALAASSASATTATVVYTRFLQPKLVDTFSAEDGGPSDQGQTKSAVVLNASQGFSGSFVDYEGDSGLGACPSDSQSCASEFQGRDVRVQILRSMPTFPPIWMGGDSEDLYTRNGNSLSGPDFDTSSSFELFIRRTRYLPKGQKGAGQDESQNDGGQVDPNNSNCPLGITAMSPCSASIPDSGPWFASVNQLGVNRSGAFEPTDVLPVADPLMGYSPSFIPAPPAPPAQSLWVARQLTGAVPEPSTWVMMLAGFASLGFASYRAARKRVGLAK